MDFYLAKRFFKFFSQHIFLLPFEYSEGFPKVIVEASNFGCIPVVSSISSISQYITHQKNGFLWHEKAGTFTQFWLNLPWNLMEEEWKRISQAAYQMAAPFTFAHYNANVQQKILIQKDVHVQQH